MERIIESDQIGPKKKYRWRTDAMRELEVGEAVLFRAETITEYASVRGSAYGLGRLINRRFVCNRVDKWTVSVRRMDVSYGRSD